MEESVVDEPRIKILRYSLEPRGVLDPFSVQAVSHFTPHSDNWYVSYQNNDLEERPLRIGFGKSRNLNPNPLLDERFSEAYLVDAEEKFILSLGGEKNPLFSYVPARGDCRVAKFDELRRFVSSRDSLHLFSTSLDGYSFPDYTVVTFSRTPPVYKDYRPITKLGLSFGMSFVDKPRY